MGGRGNGEKDAEGLARWKVGGGEGGQGGVMGRGGWQRGEGDKEGDSGRGQRGGGDVEASNTNRDGKRVAMGRGQREEEMERRAVGKGGGGKMGRGQRGGGKDKRGGDEEGEKKEQEEGRFHRWI